MNKNKMEKVAELLGVEIGEKFEIVEYPMLGYFWFDLEGLALEHNPTYYHYLINDLITGKATIKKIPFKPRKGEEYFYIVHELGNLTTDKRYNYNRWIDYLCMSMNNCFRTKEEAEKHLEEWAKKINKFFNEV